MPYIGNTPTTQFASLDYQDLTGVTGVPAKRGYTLNSAVGSANDIEVFVNNVRQEPGVAYTVSGTTLTMTGDVETTDDFYVVFQGKAVGTASHPAGNALEATSGTFTGNVDINGNELILDADADTSITADTDDQIDIKIGGSDVASFTSNGLKMVSGKGIDFSATADTAATGATANSELFDDYEEGTWTPTVSSGTIGIETNSAHYIKIGRTVIAHARIDTFSDRTSSSTQVRIGGLPFPIGSQQQNAGHAWTNNAERIIFFYGATIGDSVVDAYAGGDPSDYNPFYHSAITATSEEFLITLHYITQS